MGIKRTRRYTKPKYKCFICGSKFHREKNQIDRLKDKRLTCGMDCSRAKKQLIRKEKIEERLGIDDFKVWLEKKYHQEKINTRDIAVLVYGRKTHGPNIRGWMNKLGVPLRSSSDAVALQWEGNNERRKQAGIDAVKNMGAGTPGREKLLLYMETDEYKQKISDANSGENNWMFGRFGDKSPMWNPNLTDEDRNDTRKYKEYSEWRRLVFKRDNYICQVCKDDQGGNLTAHHLNGYHWDKTGRTDVNNGVTLCEPCHKKFHRIYGYGDNDFFQFAQFQTSETLTK